MLNHVALEGDGFADDIDFIKFAADIYEWLVLRVFRLEYEFLFVGIIIHAFERCFVPMMTAAISPFSTMFCERQNTMSPS